MCRPRDGQSFKETLARFFSLLLLPLLSLSLLSYSLFLSLILTVGHLLSFSFLSSTLIEFQPQETTASSSLSRQLNKAMPLHPNSTSSHCSHQNATGQQAELPQAHLFISFPRVSSPVAPAIVAKKNHSQIFV